MSPDRGSDDPHHFEINEMIDELKGRMTDSEIEKAEEFLDYSFKARLA